jgi:hypothetical protein
VTDVERNHDAGGLSDESNDPWPDLATYDIIRP